ncbi:hypothetical protein JCM5350_003856 [Sporobolomyces pararoseus]
MSTLSSCGITVFCGSSAGHDSIYAETATSLARAIARAGMTLVYGGGTNGLMGQVATSALEAGGRVHGITPAAFLHKEAPDRPSRLHPRQTETLCASMHERKKMMSDHCEAFVGLPGGYGTLEEVFEMTTWSQLGIQAKPVLLLNVNGYYSPLRVFIEGAIEAGFLSPTHRNFLIFVEDPSYSHLPSPALAHGEGTFQHESFDWGQAALDAIKHWKEQGTGGAIPFDFPWHEDKDHKKLDVA